MSIQQLLRDYNIPFVTEGHKHSTNDGWVNVNCPFCSGQDFHLGISETQPVSHCWRCGGHSSVDALSKLLRRPVSEIKEIIKGYGGTHGRKEVKEPRVSIHPFKLPQPHTRLNTQGKEYLAKRGFDPDRLERIWKLKQTGPISFLDRIRYDSRILIPIFWDRKMVSFQTRDISGKSDRKYLACPMAREIIHHKNIVYGKPEEWKNAETLIIVEGVADVWKLGVNAAATFGTSFKMEQVLQLSRICDKYFIIFDNEPQAQEQARKLAIKLKTLGKEAFVETVDTDPGDMNQNDANHLVKQLIGKGKRK